MQNEANQEETLLKKHLKRNLKRKLIKRGLASLIPILLIVGASVCVLMVFIGTNQESKTGTGTAGATNKDLSEEVLALRPIVEEEASKNGVSEYVPHLLGIIQVESGGKEPDPMQSSESAGLAPGTLADARSSIKQGVKYFSDLVNHSKEKKCDIWTTVQAYNFGGSYINYIGDNGGTTSTKLADNYSLTVVAPSLGNTTGRRYSYPNPVAIPYNGGFLYWNGGNFFYDLLVQQYVVEGSSEGGSDIEWDGTELTGGIVNSQHNVLDPPAEYKNKLHFPAFNKKSYPGSESYPYGQCTWYAYNRAAQLGKRFDSFMGNGGQWAVNGAAKGFNVSSTPHVGWAVSFPPGVAGSDLTYGHVAFVEYVNPDGSILVSECNVLGLTVTNYREVDAASAKQAKYIEGK